MQCLHSKPVSNHFCWGGGGEGVKSVSRGDCGKQEGNLLRLLSQLRSRIRPLVVNGEINLFLHLNGVQRTAVCYMAIGKVVIVLLIFK
jgi:hypothetical protein